MIARNIVIALAVLAVVALGTAAWYDRPDPAPTAAEAALVAELADELATVEPGDPPTALTADDARCVAAELVSRIGTTRLADLGVTAAQVAARGFDPATVAFVEDERVSVVEALDECTDLAGLAVDSLAHGRGQSARTCVADALDGEVARELWTWRVGPATAEIPARLAEPLQQVDQCLQ